MNDRIHILRQSVKVITQALTESSIEVTQQGLQAFVENDPRTNKPIRVNLPYLPDNASDELIGAVQGFLDHEVAHVLFTDFTVGAPNKEIKNLMNLIEDSRVEKEMAKKYRGSGSNLDETGEFFLKNVIEPEYFKAKEAGDEAAMSAALFTPMMRALSGQELYKHYLSDKMEQIEEVWEKLQPLAPELEKLTSTKDVAKMAKKVYRLLNDELDDENPDHDDDDEEKGEGSGGEGEDDSESKSSGGGGLAGGEKGEGDEEGEGEGAAAGGEEGKSDEGGDEGKGGGAGEEGEDGEDGTEPKDSKWKKGDDKDSERKLGDKAGAILDSLKDELNGYSESVSTKIAADSAAAMKKSKYNVFTNEGDKIEKLEVSKRNYDDSMFKRLEDKTQAMVGPMQKDLERAIQARSRAVWEAGLRKGRLNSSSLARLASTGDDRVFRKKQESMTKDVAVSLVVDASGSMSGSKIHTAAAAAYALSSVLDRLKIAHEVICFTTHTESSEWAKRREEINKAERKYKIEYSRTENLYMPIIKDWDERISTETKKRFGWLPHSGMLANNVDGECIEIAFRRLMARKENGKIMMVLSDGAPCASGDGMALRAHLKTVVQGIEKSSANIIGIGIQSSCVSDYYTKNIVINDVAELPSLVISRLKAMLLG